MSVTTSIHSYDISKPATSELTLSTYASSLCNRSTFLYYIALWFFPKIPLESTYVISGFMLEFMVGHLKTTHVRTNIICLSTPWPLHWSFSSWSTRCHYKRCTTLLHSSHVPHTRFQHFNYARADVTRMNFGAVPYPPLPSLTDLYWFVYFLKTSAFKNPDFSRLNLNNFFFCIWNTKNNRNFRQIELKRWGEWNVWKRKLSDVNSKDFSYE